MTTEKIAYCGLYCGTCGMGEGLISERATKLKEVIEAYRFEDWVTDFFEREDTQLVLDHAIGTLGYTGEEIAALKEEMEKSKFDYDQFKAGLEWFTKTGCPGCREGGGNPVCPIRMCVQAKKLRGCWECSEMEECRTLVMFEKESSYRVLESLQDIKKSGEETYAKKMEKKRAAGYDNVLDRKPFGSTKKPGKKNPKKK